ncbi:MAG: hypothetical protein LLG40_15620 [Deltaproteobacteria bacterium]|nr:hypothetical protein [Deltaproteobacteria bacterium]
MTNENWAKVEEALKHQFKIVKLKCDDYRVELYLAQVGQFKLSIGVYVNGWFKGEWFKDNNLSEEAIRFFPTHYINRYSAKEKKFWTKYPFGKKYCKEHGIDLNARKEYKGFSWKSFPALKRHFIKNNKSIELIEV